MMKEIAKFKDTIILFCSNVSIGLQYFLKNKFNANNEVEQCCGLINNVHKNLKSDYSPKIL